MKVLSTSPLGKKMTHPKEPSCWWWGYCIVTSIMWFSGCWRSVSLISIKYTCNQVYRVLYPIDQIKGESDDVCITYFVPTLAWSWIRCKHISPWKYHMWEGMLENTLSIMKSLMFPFWGFSNNQVCMTKASIGTQFKMLPQTASQLPSWTTWTSIPCHSILTGLIMLGHPPSISETELRDVTIHLRENNSISTLLYMACSSIYYQC